MHAGRFGGVPDHEETLEIEVFVTDGGGARGTGRFRATGARVAEAGDMGHTR